MFQPMSNLIPVEQVAELLEGNVPLIPADCRFVMGQPESGREAYLSGHLPNAVYFDLEKDLSGPVSAHGGRHPLPDLGKLVLKLGEIGIDETVPVVVYDDQGGAMASRLWWMLRFLGHPQVYVMDGGFSRWKEAGYPVGTGPAEPHAPRVFGARVRNRLLVGVDDVRSRLGQPGTVLIDSREAPRYRGEQEPIDRAAGHIPGAVNRFWKDNLDEDGFWKDKEALKERFAFIPDTDDIIVYCGSGVTACPNLLALAEAGRPDAKLYLGSWSDWISYDENPIATGEEEKA